MNDIQEYLDRSRGHRPGDRRSRPGTRVFRIRCWIAAPDTAYGIIRHRYFLSASGCASAQIQSDGSAHSNEGRAETGIEQVGGEPSV